MTLLFSLENKEKAINRKRAKAEEDAGLIKVPNNSIEITTL